MRIGDDKDTKQQMTTIFLSGSRSISRLAPEVQERIQNIIRNEFDVVVGDANGADKAVQKFLFANRYPNVEVYFVGDGSRNNIGNWPAVRVDGTRVPAGWERYAQKDKEMAQIADYGMVIWDGESAGSIHNVLELVKNSKIATVFFNPDKTFTHVKTVEEAGALLKRASAEAQLLIAEKIRFASYKGANSIDAQIRFGF